MFLFVNGVGNGAGFGVLKIFLKLFLRVAGEYPIVPGNQIAA
jgi:hypothetical protein